MICGKTLRGAGMNHLSVLSPSVFKLPSAAQSLLLCLLVAAVVVPSHGREKDALPYGEGLIVNIPLPESEVAQVVKDASQNIIIRGRKEYNKDEYVAGAIAVLSTPVFPKWAEMGKVFYRVRKEALDPRNFKDSGDVGTLAMRYVVNPQGDRNTVLGIYAIFVEDFRRIAHLSNVSGESAEYYTDVQDRLASINLVKKETEEALGTKREHFAKEMSSTDSAVSSSNDMSSSDVSSSKDKDLDKDKDKEILSTPPSTVIASDSTNARNPSVQKMAAQAMPAAASPSTAMPPVPSKYEESGETLEQRVAGLRRQVERLVMKPGAPPKSAPFHTASTLKSLEPGAEVLILISTMYWYGVETRDGEHGWIRRDQLEQLP